MHVLQANRGELASLVRVVCATQITILVVLA